MFDLLRGKTVLDLSTVVLGPFASQILADLGADVIKIESPDGDIFRAAAPARHAGMGAGYLNLNRNKRSLVLDLKTPGGREALLGLARDADVLLHNMRPAAVRKLGIDHDTIAGINPGLVYCAAVGFGSDGPYADEPAYDDVIQAMTGFASLFKGEDSAPSLIPTVLTDKVAGLYTVIGILGGLLSRERTGQGLAVEAPMFESLVSFILAEHLSGYVFDPAIGPLRYSRVMSPHRRPYATADGYIAVLPYSTKHWERFLRLTTHAELAEAPWVRDDAKRSERIGELYEIVAQTMPKWTTAKWLSEFKRLDIPCGPVNDLEDLFDDPHLRAIGFFQQTRHPSEGALTTMRQPLRFSAAETRPDLPAPSLGQNGRDILQEYGLSTDQIQHLVESGAIVLPDEAMDADAEPGLR